MVYLREPNTSSLHMSLQPTDSLPAETQAFRTIIFIDASKLLNRKHNSKITIFFLDCAFSKYPKKTFEFFLLRQYSYLENIFKKYFFTSRGKARSLSGRNGHFLLFHYSKTHISKDFTNQLVNRF